MNKLSRGKIVDMINKELCERSSVLRIRKQPVGNDIYAIGLKHDPFIEDEVAIEALTLFILLVFTVWVTFKLFY